MEHNPIREEVYNISLSLVIAKEMVDAKKRGVGIVFDLNKSQRTEKYTAAHYHEKSAANFS